MMAFVAGSAMDSRFLDFNPIISICNACLMRPDLLRDVPATHYFFKFTQAHLSHPFIKNK